ncbi:ATP phosphoribosyltransferase [Achlya hypogyna]|uniref:ATP phosphoribosyltransferase n=1 Tax=Achlya hypogyna TaxID=1202772 RepID=A0A1V9YHM8_ACHHY|nr:ATP phosphoribosyltransferase [Achlya hypogyna]
MHNNLIFVIPTKVCLYESVVKLLNGAGLDYNWPYRLDIAHVTLVFLPTSDIAKYVGEGNVDLGITGQDIIAESKTTKLEFGRCELAVQAPIDSVIKSIRMLWSTLAIVEIKYVCGSVNDCVETRSFFAVSAMVHRGDVGDIMDDHYELGATNIVVFDLENCTHSQCALILLITTVSRHI